MPERDQQKTDNAASSPASPPDELLKDLEVKTSEEDQIKGGAADIFAKIGDIKGESRR